MFTSDCKWITDILEKELSASLIRSPIPTIQKELLNALPHLVSHEQVNAAGSFVRDLVSAQVQHFDLLQTSQVRSIAQLSNSLISDVILAQIQDFQMGQELGAQHSMDGLNSLGFNRVLGEIKASKGRSEAILNSKTQMTQLPLVEAAFPQFQLIERWHDVVSQQNSERRHSLVSQFDSYDQTS